MKSGIVFFSPKTLGFYPAAEKPAFDEAGTFPDDAKLLSQDDQDTFWKATPPAGKILSSQKSRPVWVDQVDEPMDLDQAKNARLASYREESDQIKIEADYDAALTGKAPDYSLWLEKVAEIKSRYPLPQSS